MEYFRELMNSPKERGIMQTIYYLKTKFGTLKDFVLATNEYGGYDLHFHEDNNGNVYLHIAHDNRLCCDAWELGHAWNYTTKNGQPIHVNKFPELMKAWQDHGIQRITYCDWCDFAHCLCGFAQD